MARYDTYGQADDRVVEDLDQGFSGFNNKLRPDQLPSYNVYNRNRPPAFYNNGSLPPASPPP